MNVSTAVQERRAEKFFDPVFAIGADEVRRLLQKANLAPTVITVINAQDRQRNCADAAGTSPEK